MNARSGQNRGEHTSIDVIRANRLSDVGQTHAVDRGDGVRSKRADLIVGCVYNPGGGVRGPVIGLAAERRAQTKRRGQKDNVTHRKR